MKEIFCKKSTENSKALNTFKIPLIRKKIGISSAAKHTYTSYRRRSVDGLRFVSRPSSTTLLAIGESRSSWKVEELAPQSHGSNAMPWDGHDHRGLDHSVPNGRRHVLARLSLEMLLFLLCKNVSPRRLWMLVLFNDLYCLMFRVCLNWYDHSCGFRIQPCVDVSNEFDFF